MWTCDTMQCHIYLRQIHKNPINSLKSTSLKVFKGYSPHLVNNCIAVMPRFIHSPSQLEPSHTTASSRNSLSPSLHAMPFHSHCVSLVAQEEFQIRLFFLFFSFLISILNSFQLDYVQSSGYVYNKMVLESHLSYGEHWLIMQSYTHLKD